MDPKLQDLSDKVDELQTSLDAEQQQVKDLLDAKDGHITELQATIDLLIAQQADGGTPAERQAILDKMNALLADMKGTVPDEETPPA